MAGPTFGALDQHAETIARALLGEPNKALSTKAQLRFGTHGSVAVEIVGKKAGTWYDHATESGGGLLTLIVRERGGTRREAFEWLKSIGINLAWPGNGAAGAPRRRVCEYVYRDRIGDPLYRVVRWQPRFFSQERYDASSRRFVGGKGCMAGVPRVPYRLDEWLDQPGRIFVTEGEKDADAIAATGELAITNAGGAGKWSDDFAHYFAGREVIICGDNDQAGKKHARQVVASLKPVAGSVCAIEVPREVGKDASDWLDAGHTIEELLAHYTPQRNRATVQPLAVEPPELAQSVDILAAFTRDIRLRGLVGEDATAQLIYLAITSRLLAKPVSLVVKGHSSSGKSHTLDRVLEFIPDDAVIKFTGMSKRALVYRDDDYQHRTLVVLRGARTPRNQRR
jgi:hypothetical protein